LSKERGKKFKNNKQGLKNLKKKIQKLWKYVSGSKICSEGLESDK
jgi:ribosomal protein S15P/S13E